jgi:hypothetical protein
VTETVYTKEEVDDMLGDLGEAESVVEYIEAAIEGLDVESKLGNYYKKDETYSQDETDAKIEAKIGDKLGDIINADGEDITVQEYIEEKTSTNGGKNYYRATYGKTMIGENEVDHILTLWEADQEFDPAQPGEVEITPVSQFQIVGGNGSDATLNTLIIYYEEGASGQKLNSYSFREKQVSDKEAIIKYSFVGTEPNGATIASADAKWEYREGTSGKWRTIKNEQIAPTGEGEFLEFNISEYLPNIATYQFKLTVTDPSGAEAYGNWTVKHIKYKIETIDSEGRELFSDKKTYKIEDTVFSYIPYGVGLKKTVHFVWDGREISTRDTERSGSVHEFTLPISHIPEQARHGSHLLEVYMTATINGEPVRSDSLYKDIVLYDPNRTVPVIGCAPQEYTIKQYSTLNIEYVVFDPTTNYPKVVINIDGVEEEKTLETSLNLLSFKSSEADKTHTIIITCTNDKTNIVATKTLTIHVQGLGYDISPVTGAVIDFDPVGKSNSERVQLQDTSWKVWDNGIYSITVEDGFDWVNGGFQTEKDKDGKIIPGTEHFKIKNGDKAVLNYKFFGGDRLTGTASNPWDEGKDFKLIFKTDRVQKSNAKFLSCLSENNGNPIGMEMSVTEGNIYCSGGQLTLPYSENDIIEYGFKIASKNSKTPIIMGYEDGVTTSAFVYNSGHSFLQAEDDRKYIEIAPDGCDVYIYKLKIYEKELTDEQMLQNFKADARTGEEMVNRHTRNLIYNDNEELDPKTLAQKCPWLRVITISTPKFTQSKKNPVGETTIEYRYENGKQDGSISYWKCVDGVHIGQGTSSDKYGAAGRNIDLVLKTHKDIGNTPTIYLDEEET